MLSNWSRMVINRRLGFSSRLMAHSRAVRTAGFAMGGMLLSAHSSNAGGYHSTSASYISWVQLSWE